MKKSFVSLLAAFASAASYAQSATTDYNNVMNRFQYFYNAGQDDSIITLMSARARTIFTPEKARTQFGQLHAQLGRLTGYSFTKEQDGIFRYKADFENVTMSILTKMDSAKQLDMFRIVRYVPDAEPLLPGSAEVSLKVASGTLYGTLSVPVSPQKVSVVFIIPGSGPTDRDGNSSMGVRGAVYRKLSDGLYAEGIACLRYDKRGVAQSAAALGHEDSLTFEDGVNDAAAFLNMLRTDVRFSQVFIIGHSEGSLIGMLAAGKIQVDGLVSLAGAGEPAGSILKRQLQERGNAPVARINSIIDSIASGQMVADVPPSLELIFRKDVQHYLASWMKYDPAKEIAKVKVPVMIVQGTTDIQVSVTDAELLKSGHPSASVKWEQGMNHVLRTAPADKEKNIATYSDADARLFPGLLSDITAFIKQKR